MRWSEVAGDVISVDAETQWSDIVSTVHPDPNLYYEPETGTIEELVASQLSAVLSAHTQSRDCMYFVWEGYSSLLDEVRESPTITNGLQRNMHVRRGTFDEAPKPIYFPATRLAMNWLPGDGAWFVGNDIYARSVFVGGSLPAIGAVLREPGLEAYVVRSSYTVVPED